MSIRWLLPLLPCTLILIVRADGPADNRVENVKPVPPPGIRLADADRKALQDGVDELGKQIDLLRDSLKAKPNVLALLPDVQIYDKAVRSALAHNEFYNLREVAVAKKLLAQGLARAGQLRDGEGAMECGDRVNRARICFPDRRLGSAVWARGAGLVPAEYASSVPARCLVPRPRGDAERVELLERPAVIAWRIHAAERVCRASLRPLLQRQQVRRRDRSLRGDRRHQETLPDRRRPAGDEGFLDGGAACWQFAVHYPSMWAAAAPGAGFAETADYLKVFQKGSVPPTWYEQKLWHLYDSTDYALNLFNCPTVAYSGEVDRQKQAADMMARRSRRKASRWST